SRGTYGHEDQTARKSPSLLVVPREEPNKEELAQPAATAMVEFGSPSRRRGPVKDLQLAAGPAEDLEPAARLAEDLELAACGAAREGPRARGRRRGPRRRLQALQR
ncbi:unnamed protein product, partial [Urochloa humidicola]